MFNPFEYTTAFTKPLRITDSPRWLNNVPFAFAIIEAHRPRVLVELGTHTGVSYCAFCQAVKILQLSTRCYAVDTWTGDEHAGFYGQEVLDDLIEHHDPLYSQFSTLLKMDFAQALDHFSDGTIDLLHIDGCHLYEAVKHDFKSWLRKLSKRGIVLLHDTNAPESEFGVGKFFKELQSEYPVFEFIHGDGLGLVAVGRELDHEEIWNLCHASPEHLNVIRLFYDSLGTSLLDEWELNAQIRHKDAIIEHKDAIIAERNAHIHWRDVLIAHRDFLVWEGKAMAEELVAQIDRLNEKLAQYETRPVGTVSAKLKRIGSFIGSLWK
jgi:hypothetical protein